MERGVNAYVLRAATGEAAVIDPGVPVGKLLGQLQGAFNFR